MAEEGRTRRILAASGVRVLATLPVWLSAFDQLGSWVPAGDSAAIVLRARDVGTEHNPTLGMPPTFGGDEVAAAHLLLASGGEPELRGELSQRPLLGRHRTARAGDDCLIVHVNRQRPQLPGSADVLLSYDPPAKVLAAARRTQADVTRLLRRQGPVRLRPEIDLPRLSPAELVRSGDVGILAQAGLLTAPRIPPALLHRLLQSEDGPLLYVRVHRPASSRCE